MVLFSLWFCLLTIVSVLKTQIYGFVKSMVLSAGDRQTFPDKLAGTSLVREMSPDK